MQKGTRALERNKENAFTKPTGMRRSQGEGKGRGDDGNKVAELL